MTAKCAMCGRPTEPYAYIGAEALGPKCARRMGILKGKIPKGGSIRFVKHGHKSPRERYPVTMDLFEQLEKKDMQQNEEVR